MNLYVGDWIGNRIRKVDITTGNISTIAGMVFNLLQYLTQVDLLSTVVSMYIFQILMEVEVVIFIV